MKILLLRIFHKVYNVRRIVKKKLLLIGEVVIRWTSTYLWSAKRREWNRYYNKTWKYRKPLYGYNYV